MLRRIKARQLLVARGRRHIVVIQQILERAQGLSVAIQNPALAKRIMASQNLKRTTLPQLKATMERLKARIDLLESKANGTSADIQSAYARARLFARQRAAGL